MALTPSVIVIPGSLAISVIFIVSRGRKCQLRWSSRKLVCLLGFPFGAARQGQAVESVRARAAHVHALGLLLWNSCQVDTRAACIIQRN